MSRRNETESEWLRETLRGWDPVRDGQELDASERARMRRRVLSVAVEPTRLGMPARALATAAVVVMTVALGWGLYDDAVRRPSDVSSAGTPARHVSATDSATGAERQARQIQFSTPGGTRVIWTLDPDFGV